MMTEYRVSCGSEYSHMYIRKAFRILPVPRKTRRLHRRYGESGHTTSRSVNRQPIGSTACFAVIHVTIRLSFSFYVEKSNSVRAIATTTHIAVRVGSRNCTVDKIVTADCERGHGS
jgi:hypothetical protein